MKISIKLFIIFIFIISIGASYIHFSLYFLKQREQTATVIMKSLQNEISKMAYLISKRVRGDEISLSRSILDRESASNDYISAIAVFDDDKLLVTTDPAYSKPLNAMQLYVKQNKSSYEMLTQYQGIEENIHYYDGNHLKYYNLIFFIDQQYIKDNFTKSQQEFLLLFILLPIGAFFILWVFVQIIVVKPLEKLRQYAYYQSEIPPKMKIREMEYIRSSMVQTFDRLEQERTELYNLARTDSLSGLANRNLLHERTEQIIAESERYDKEFAVLFLDLDHFKSINDSLGHDVGDELLRKIALTVQEVVRINDVVARIGGDEFIIVLTHYQDHLELIEIIKRIQKRLMEPWKIRTYPIQITSSIGIAIYPKDGNNLLSLMKNADIAMYQAKDNGRSQYSFFTEALNKRTQNYIALTNDMRKALEQDDYMLYFQPQNDMHSGAIIGAEALIRWNDPQKGIISPHVFIPLAEQNGFIIELGDWIIDAALKQKQIWESKGIDIKLSINIAAKQIVKDGFIPMLKSLLTKYPVDVNKIAFEITEYVFLENDALVHKIFKQIKALGIEISLDDFGTGYSSLSYLKAYPIDTVKIDKIFLNDYATHDGAIFLETMVKMAQTLKLKVIAEGVEEKAQIEYLKRLNCDYYQGYFCSQPVDPVAFEKLYTEHTKDQCL